MRDDAYGALIKPRVIKVFYSGEHTWNMKLSQIGRESTKHKKIYIATYSLPDVRAVKDILKHRPTGQHIQLICHSKFSIRAQEVKDAFPDIQIRCHPSLHSKVCIMEPETMFIGSANFGRSRWHESMVGIKSTMAVKEYLEYGWMPIWASATLI